MAIHVRAQVRADAPEDRHDAAGAHGFIRSRQESIRAATTRAPMPPTPDATKPTLVQIGAPSRRQCCRGRGTARRSPSRHSLLLPRCAAASRAFDVELMRYRQHGPAVHWPNRRARGDVVGEILPGPLTRPTGDLCLIAQPRCRTGRVACLAPDPRHDPLRAEARRHLTRRGSVAGACPISVPPAISSAGSGGALWRYLLMCLAADPTILGCNRRRGK
jgi:hypothetical protein